MLRCVSLLAFASALLGQSVEGPVFEAASLKKLGSDVHDFQQLKGGPGTSTPTRAGMRFGVGVLLLEAFDLQLSRFVNLNKAPEGFYEFAAVVPEGATKDEFRTMLRNLLIERFHLRYHRETREIKSYEVRLAEGGPKLKPAANDPPSALGKVTRLWERMGTWCSPPASTSRFGATGPDSPYSV